MQAAGSGGKEVGRVAFHLRGRNLAAEDTHLTKANSSDPFYKLLVS